jgi:hypothetical protein
VRRLFSSIFPVSYRAPKPLHLTVDMRITIKLDNVMLATNLVGDSVVLGAL